MCFLFSLTLIHVRVWCSETDRPIKTEAEALTIWQYPWLEELMYIYVSLITHLHNEPNSKMTYIHPNILTMDLTLYNYTMNINMLRKLSTSTCQDITSTMLHSSWNTHIKHSEHGLRDVECVPPVVVRDWSIVFLYTTRPSTHHL